MTAPISRKQKKIGIKHLAKILGNLVYDSLCSAPWLFCFTLLELVKGRVKGSKERRGVDVRCKGWSPYNRFLRSCSKTWGYKKSEDVEFPATRGLPYILLSPESCDSYRKPIYSKWFNGLPFMGILMMKQTINYQMGLGGLVSGLRAFWWLCELVIGDFSCFRPNGVTWGFLPN